MKLIEKVYLGRILGALGAMVMLVAFVPVTDLSFLGETVYLTAITGLYVFIVANITMFAMSGNDEVSK